MQQQRGLKIEGRIPLIVMKGKFTKVKRNSHVGEDAKFISYGLRRTRTILKKRLPKLIQRASIGHVLWVMMEHLLE